MSDINFSKLTWENLPARTTALSATNLNRIENGIADSVNGVNSNSHSIAELQTRISQMSGGVPPTASSTSGMNPEVSTVYVNTTDGKWYYWDGSAWQIGGVYGGAVTDTTLSISGAAADAKAVGDALADKADADDVTALETALESKADADDVDARFDTVEQAIEDVAFDGMDMLLTEVSDTVYSGNLVDNTNVRLNGQWVYDLRMSHPVDGVYYSNPLAGTMAFANARSYDSDGNSISFVGSTNTDIRVSDYGYVWKWEISNQTSITATSYTSLAAFNNNTPRTKTTYTLSAIPAYWIISGKAAANPATSTDANFGMTAEPSETYVPYVEPVVTHSYEYADELDEHIGDIVSEKLGGLNYDADIQFEPSYNLIDVSQFNDAPVNGYWTLKAGYYFRVTAGKKICTSAYKPRFYFYDATYTDISNEATVNVYTLVDIPVGAVWARMTINANGVPSIEPHMVVYEVPGDTPSNDDHRMWVPPTKIKGSLVEGDIYDTAVPQNLSIDILTASAYKAVRVLNHQRNAFRIGTFNIYVPRQSSHWSQLKQELKDHSIDICAMQEVGNNIAKGRYVQNFLTLNTWQFKYGSQAIFDGTASDKATVSVYEIVSTELFTNSTGRTYTRTVINLPQYKRNAHQFTLSVYSAHLNLTASNRLIEASEILATVAQDTSDFIVICMDSNTFKSEADEQGKLPTWETFISAGFTPIHYGEYSTVTDLSDTDTSIDQIFMGENISLIDYDIVNSNDYPVTINGSSVPISDHCMVYADLAFDFDAVLSALQGV